MENYLWENILSKYILKKIFSYIKVTKALKIIKLSEKIKTRIDISLFPYQYCFFYSIFKKEKIEKIEDIIESPHLKMFPDDTKYELIFKFIEAKKLFHDEYSYLNIEDKNIIYLLQILNEKQINTSFNYIIGNIEEKKEIDKYIEKNYHNNITKIIHMEKNNIEKILFDYNFFFDNSNILILNINLLNVKYLFLNVTNYETVYNISLFENLEYLSIKSSREFKIKEKIKIILNEIQYKKIKTLKIIHPDRKLYEIEDLIFETKNAESKYFENLKELFIEEKLINQIKLNPANLKKLNISYDFRNKLYTLVYTLNSINNIFQNYSSLICLNIIFNKNIEFYKEMGVLTKLIFDYYVINIENFSLNFKLENFMNFTIKKNKNQKLKFIIKRIDKNNIPFTVFESHFDKIEKFEFGNFYKNDNYALYINNNNSISSLSLNRITKKNGFTELFINDISDLKLLHIDSIELFYDFPLFSSDSSIKFLNLEYLLIYSSDINIISAIINKLPNIPNLRFLSIYHSYFDKSDLLYHKLIFSKCELLKKLEILIINDFQNGIIEKAFEYYSIYPELKNTTIKLCSFSKTSKK